MAMVGLTIAERFCHTKHLAARDILQDAASMFGAQHVVSEQLETKLARAEKAEQKDWLSTGDGRITSPRHDSTEVRQPQYGSKVCKAPDNQSELCCYR
jgi:hypothetical protein